MPGYMGEVPRESSHDLVYLTFWKQRAQEIRHRDKVCRHCGKTAQENGRALDVHHIVPYHISHDNSHENLITLCRSCHAKADKKGSHPKRREVT